MPTPALRSNFFDSSTVGANDCPATEYNLNATRTDTAYDNAAVALTNAATALTTANRKLDADQFVTNIVTYTLTSQTAVQKLFGTTANGAVTVVAGSYFFECFFDLSAMSATSGSFGWVLFPVTATITAIKWVSVANKAALTTAAAPQSTVNNTTANTALATASTSTVGWAKITGKTRIAAGGTIIPGVSLGVAAAAVVGVDSYFRIWPVGSDIVTNSGTWS